MLVVAAPEAAGPWWTHDRDSSGHRGASVDPANRRPRRLLEIGPTDAVLLSHDQPGDNLDRSRRALFAHADVVLTAPEGADRLGRGVADNDRLRVIAAGERITL
jgi:hypothetical protein